MRNRPAHSGRNWPGTRAGGRGPSGSKSWRMRRPLQDVAAEVLVLHQLPEVCVDVLGVDGHLSLAIAGPLTGLVGHGLEQPFDHGLQAPRADVLGALVDVEGDLGDAPNAVGREIHLYALGSQERLVLRRE